MLNQWIRKVAFMSCIVGCLACAPKVSAMYVEQTYSMSGLVSKFELTGASQDTYGADVDLTGIVASVGPLSGQIYLFPDKDSHGVPGIFIDPSSKVSTRKLQTFKPGQVIRVKGKIHLATGACWYIEPNSIELVEEN